MTEYLMPWNKVFQNHAIVRQYGYYVCLIFNIISSMGPILKYYHPLKGVGIIKIYRPTVLDDYTISFLVTVDSRILTLKLYQTGEWNEVQKQGISNETLAFIHEKIEQFYQQQ